MKSQVITVSSYDPKPDYYRPNAFRASLGKFGVVPTNLGEGAEWHGLMTKPRLYRKFLREGRQQGDVLIVCDSWDVFFQAHPDEVVDRYQEVWPNQPLVFNSERNCFPCTEKTKAWFDDCSDDHLVVYPEHSATPWKYLNSGFLVGPPKKVLHLLEAMNLDAIPDDHQLPDGSWFNPNDQEQFQLAYMSPELASFAIDLDRNTELCMAAHGSTLDELDFSGPRIKNKITGSTPCVFHCNGDAKNNLAPKILEHLGLPPK